MFPVALNLQTVSIVLAGRGERLEKRLAQLDAYGAARLRVFSDAPTPALVAAAQGRLVAALPDASAMAQASVVLIVGLPQARSQALADQARALGRLVHVEDNNDLCDFYFTANLRRGDLVIAVSTGGASPTLARRIRDRIARLFGEEWGGRVQELSALRLSLKARGAGMDEVVRATDQALAARGWLAGKDEAA